MDKQLKERLEKAYANLQIVDPNYDPFSGHRWHDGFGKSEFAMVGNAHDILEALMSVFGSDLINEDTSQPGTVFLKFRAIVNIGHLCFSKPDADAEYCIEMVHGAPQAVGHVADQSEFPTPDWTAVLTEEKVNDGYCWCLASVYPGRPDSGILPKEFVGRIVKGSTLIDLGIDRVVIVH